MLTRARLKRAIGMRVAGSGRSAGRSSASKALARQPGSFLNGRSFRSASSSAIAALSSARLKKRRLRKARQDPALDHLHPDFDLRLVARMSGARREHRHVVVVAELLDQAVDGRLVAVGPRDQGARLVGHDQPRHAADELQRVDDRADPVGRGLRRRGAGVGVVRRAQHGHEDLRARISPVAASMTGTVWPA